MIYLSDLLQSFYLGKYHINFVLLDCWDILVGQLISQNILISNGTTVYATDENTNIYFDSCDNNMSFGHKLGESNTQMSKIFNGTGDATLEFGNCWTTGYLSVLINRTEIGRMYGQTEASFKISYSKGDVLSIQQFNASFAINGCGKLHYYYFSYCFVIKLHTIAI